MADERTYYVLCADNCKFEGMTKEQILAAITQAVESGEINDVDTGFVTKIKEQNANAGLTFWIGTQAEYNALAEKLNNCLYLITDDTTAEDINAALTETQAQTSEVAAAVTQLKNWQDAKEEKEGRVLCENASGITKGTEIFNITNYSVVQVFVKVETFEAAVLCSVFTSSDTGKIYIRGLSPQAYGATTQTSGVFEQFCVMLSGSIMNYTDGRKSVVLEIVKAGTVELSASVVSFANTLPITKIIGVI